MRLGWQKRVIEMVYKTSYNLRAKQLANKGTTQTEWRKEFKGDEEAEGSCSHWKSLLFVQFLP